MQIKETIHIKDIELQRNLLLQINPNANFDVIIGGSKRKLIDHDNNVIYTNYISGYSYKELGFISRVRADIIKNCKNWEFEHSQKLPHYQPHYVDWIKKIPKLKTNLLEIDLTAAYWYLAHELGYVSTQIFNEGFNYPKKIRLVCLGAIAKQDKIISIRSGEFEGVTTKRHKYSAAFFNIAKYVNDIMNLAKFNLGPAYLFYWVDAIFFENTPENLKICTDLFNECNLKFKIFKVEKIEYFEESAELWVYSSNHSRNRRLFNLKK